MTALAGVSRRPESEADTPFLLSLYAATREAELARVDWTDAEKRAFISMQFDAQRQHYRRLYPDARFDILEQAGEAIGRFYLRESASEVRIIDIALAPPARNRGIGSALLQEVLARAAETDRTVVIHVERFNPARRLYERLGFEPAGGDAVYLRMEVRPRRVPEAGGG